MQISEIREAIATAARAVVLPTGIRKLTTTGFTPDAVTEPHFFVGEYTVDYDVTYGRSSKAEFTCRLLVGRANDQAAQRLADDCLSDKGPASLKVAIEAARGAPGALALGGLADDLHVMRVQGYRWYEHAGSKYVGAELIIKVIGS